MEKTTELMEWMQSRTRIIDLPRDYSEREVLELLEISKLENTNSKELEIKIKEFKSKYI